MNELLMRINQTARRCGDASVLRTLNGNSNTTTELSWRQLWSQVEHTAASLRHHHVRCLGLMLANSAAWIVADLAAQHAGIALVPLPDFFTHQQLMHLCSRAGIDGILSDNPTRLQALGYDVEGTSAELDTESPSMDEMFTQSIRIGYNRTLTPMTLHDGTEKITFTSGTTGQPRGVCLGHASQYHTALALNDLLHSRHIRRHLCVLPLSVLLENVAGVWSTLLAEGELIVLPTQLTGLLGSSRFDPDQLATSIDRYEPESMILLPEMLRALVAWCTTRKRRFPSLKLIAVGGSRVPPPLLQQARACGLPVAQGYGLSECASVVCLDTVRRGRFSDKHPLGTVGRCLPHWQISVADDQELIVSGESFLGYLGEPRHEGPIFTGDLGRVDEQGLVTVMGRKKNLLISSYGRNISPEWVESELCVQPEIAQAWVFGDAQPWCGAVLVARPGVCAQGINAAVLRANSTLPDYARIVRWLSADAPFCVENNQLTANGRLRRDSLLQHYTTNIARLYQARCDDSTDYNQPDAQRSIGT